MLFYINCLDACIHSMSMPYRLLLIILTLPAFLTLLHDGYRYYNKPEEGFKLRATGFYWVSLSPDSFKATSEALPPETWRTINRILIFPGLYVFGGLSLLLYALLGLFNRGRTLSGGAMDSYDRMDFLRDDKRRGNKGYKYNRRR